MERLKSTQTTIINGEEDMLSTVHKRSSAESANRIGRSVIAVLRRRQSTQDTGLSCNNHADEENKKGRLGLNMLHTVPEPLIDFIFVHGLGGGSTKTWSIPPDPQRCWPEEWLPNDPDFDRVRIHSFGYKADWDERGGSVLNIHDFSRYLLSELHNSQEIRQMQVRTARHPISEALFLIYE
jgi:hypothetical protein